MTTVKRCLILTEKKREKISTISTKINWNNLQRSLCRQDTGNKFLVHFFTFPSDDYVSMFSQ